MQSALKCSHPSQVLRCCRPSQGCLCVATPSPQGAPATVPRVTHWGAAYRNHRWVQSHTRVGGGYTTL